MKKTGFWLCIIGVILLAAIVSAVLLYGGGEKPTAEITVDGALYRQVDLRREQKFTVESEWGSNTVIVEDGTIRVETATCPDHVCIKQGACSGGVPIVCLPNRMVISFSDAAEADAIAG